MHCYAPSARGVCVACIEGSNGIKCETCIRNTVTGKEIQSKSLSVDGSCLQECVATSGLPELKVKARELPNLSNMNAKPDYNMMLCKNPVSKGQMPVFVDEFNFFQIYANFNE